MSQIESEQVKLRLTANDDVLQALRKRRSLKKNKRGEYIALQFDGKTFEFYKGVTVTVGKNVGDALRRESGVIVGDDLTGDYLPSLEQVGTFRLGESEAEDQRSSMTSCPVCGLECNTLKGLARHLERFAKRADHRPDLYEKAVKPRPKTQWDANVSPTASNADEDADDAADDVVDDIDGGSGDEEMEDEPEVVGVASDDTDAAS